ncbi:MAG: GUN4 domain-containing protein, partial [Okeania sp. SIO3C4]|nr:GUN4 domain-containing protein [Okeania sp. SIO3C4]
MSGAPVVDVKGEVVAVHGMSDVEVVQNFASLQASLSESQQSTFQQAVERVETGVRWTFSWGIPINLFVKYWGSSIALGKDKLKEEPWKYEWAEWWRKLQAELQKDWRKLQVDLQRQDEERRKWEEAKRQKQVENEIPLVSAKGVDYKKLRDLLAARKWKEAHKETDKVMLKVAGRESEGWLRYEDVKNFSCQDLGIIDKLWVKHSNGKFGFSVQKEIFRRLGGMR